MAEKWPGVRLVSRPRLVRREAVVSLDTSRTRLCLAPWGDDIAQSYFHELTRSAHF